MEAHREQLTKKVFNCENQAERFQ